MNGRWTVVGGRFLVAVLVVLPVVLSAPSAAQVEHAVTFQSKDGGALPTCFGARGADGKWILGARGSGSDGGFKVTVNQHEVVDVAESGTSVTASSRERKVEIAIGIDGTPPRCLQLIIEGEPSEQTTNARCFSADPTGVKEATVQSVVVYLVDRAQPGGGCPAS